MTKKDYILIARAFNRLTFTNTTHEPNKAKWVAEELANILKEDNSKFNREKFLTACGIKLLDTINGYEADSNNPADEMHY